MARRFLLPALLAAVVLSGLTAALSVGAAAIVPRCPAAQLHFKYVDNQGAASHRYFDFAFVNRGATCAVAGYPRVALLGRHGHPLAARVTHLGGSHAATVTVGHGKRAFFTVQWADGGACPAPHVVAYKLRLTAPGASASSVYGLGGAVSMCKGSAHVWPLRAKLAPFARDAGSPTCPVSSLRLDAIGGQAFTSHREIALALRNVSAQTCHLKGFPGAGLLDAHAAQLSPTVHRVPGPTPTLTLHTWQRAFFNVVYTVGGPCVPHTLTAYALAVIPPNDVSHLVYYLGKTVMCAPPNATVTAVSHTPGP